LPALPMAAKLSIYFTVALEHEPFRLKNT